MKVIATDHEIHSYKIDTEIHREGEVYFATIYYDQVTYAQVLGALACYEYQACESDTWKKSYAFALCQAIRRSICRMISGDNWSYTRPANRVRII